MEPCTCPHVCVGLTVTETRCWSEDCAEHGVGTAYFQALPVKPFGFASEAETTRAEWLAWRAADRP